MVPSGGNLQAAINAAQPGDTILLQAGATWTGNYTLPVKSGTGVITIRSSASDTLLPAAGVRISPADAANLPKIRSDANGAALKTSGATGNWRLLFLEFEPSASNSSANLVELGVAGSSQSTLASVPQHLVIDRCYLHGSASYGQRRGVALNSGDKQVINSYFSDFKGVLQDTQAIGGWNGPGPFLIENNYVEAAGENIMFGGSDPNIPNLVPSNIVIRRNKVTKQLAWMSESWTVKNLIEFKNAANVVVEGNTRNDGVDLQTTTDVGGGYKIKTAVAGEWLNYSVSVAAAGTFTFVVRVSSGGAGGTFRIEVDGVDKTGSLTVSNTGGWESWTTVAKSGIAIAAGPHVVRLVLDTNGATGMTGNFNWFAVQ